MLWTCPGQLFSAHRASPLFPALPAGDDLNERTEQTVSEPKENKSQTKAQRQEKRRQEEQAHRRSMALYSLVGVVVVVAAVAMILWNTGIFQRNLTAVEVGSSKYTAADVELYYNSAYNSIVRQYMETYYTTPFDTSSSTKKQVYNEETGETWYDYLMDQAMTNLKNDTVLSAKATAEGYTLSENAQQDLDDFVKQLDTAWLAQYSSRDAYIRTNYGSFMTYDRLVELVNMQMLASDYLQSQVKTITHGEEDYETYYSENAASLDTYTYTQFVFQATVATTDEEGNTIEMTEEEKSAALEEAKAEKKALAEELQAKLEAGEDAQALAEEYADQLYSSVISRKSTGSTLVTNGAPYAQWMMDASRQTGDVTLTEADYTSSFNYYVVLLEGRQRDNTPAVDVRHILVAAEQDESATEPTQEQYDAAYAKAEELLNQWKAGEATEDSFATLAEENSADAGSASNGGLISNVSTTSGYVDTFANWALDPSRQPGDTGIVQNTGSSTKGWHIMYFVSSNDPIWKQSAADGLMDQDYENVINEATDGVTLTQSTGMSFVSVK